MTPDPFRRLDRIDPPDQWADITHRATGDDADLVDTDLDVVRHLRPRRRATLLVAAAAAAVALVAGVTIADVGDAGDDGVTAGPSEPAGPSMPGPCPFAVEPGPPEQVVTPGAGPVEVPAALAEMAAEDPTLDIDLDMWTRGSWGRTTFEGTEMSISVYADGGTDVTPLGPWTDARLVDDARGKELLIIGTNVIEGSPTCRTVQVQFRAPLSEADAARRQAAADDAAREEIDAQIDLEAYETYGAQYEDQVARVLAAVRLWAPAAEGPVSDGPDPCATLVDPDEPPAPPTTEPAEPEPPFTFGGVMADGRTYTAEAAVEDGEDVVWVEVEGSDEGGGGTRPDGPGDLGWTWTGGDTGVAVGWRPPAAVATAAVRPDGTLATAGLALSPGGTLYALPDVGQAPGQDGEQEVWPIVHCDADGHAIAERSLSELDEELSRQIAEEAREYQESLAEIARCEEDPSTCTTTTAAGPPPPLGPFGEVTSSFGGTLPDGRPYLVEGDGVQHRLLIDGEDYGSTNIADEVGDVWTVSVPPSTTDGLVVGYRPANTTTTTILARDGTSSSAGLSVSDDGTFYAIYGPVDGDGPHVTHVLAGGEVIEIP